MQTLGQVTVPVTTNWWSGFAGDAAKQIFLLLGIIGVVAVIVVVWIIFIRKPKTRERRKYPQYHEHKKTGPEVVSGESDPDDDDSPEAADGKSSKHHGRRRRKETHRPRNPTLAETGGLPPLRDPGQPPLQ